MKVIRAMKRTKHVFWYQMVLDVNDSIFSVDRHSRCSFTMNYVYGKLGSFLLIEI